MNKKQRKVFYPTLFFLGLILMAWQIAIYRNTIIDLKILVGIILLVGILAFFMDVKNYGKTYKYNGIGLYFYAAMHYICGFGFIVCSLFMLSNYYLAETEPIKKEFEIIERSSLPGSGKYRKHERQPTFNINYNGELKELVFPHKYYEKRNFYSIIELETRKGYFGFDILEHKNLK
ncbi:hypothetical protein [Winogradskyella helgolandensis]|uniref:hypothetical protein n=1 Tax=Winogradskyella helgolandensis TaxID=2697010 RepID=UPI0015C80493|nr:hypothetical protein [Winogradskyella helgolandensis]